MEVLATGGWEVPGDCNPKEVSAPCHHLVMGTEGWQDISSLGMKNIIVVILPFGNW